MIGVSGTSRWWVFWGPLGSEVDFQAVVKAGKLVACLDHAVDAYSEFRAMAQVDRSMSPSGAYQALVLSASVCVDRRFGLRNSGRFPCWTTQFGGDLTVSLAVQLFIKKFVSHSLPDDAVRQELATKKLRPNPLSASAVAL